MWERLFNLALQKRIRLGALQIHTPDGRRLNFGNGEGKAVVLRLSDPGFFRRFVLSPELATGEAYMDGTLEIDDDNLEGLLKIAVRNENTGSQLSAERLYAPLAAVFTQANFRARSRRNVAHHYDLSGELYELFLDRDRQYSCAYFRDPKNSLENAQEQKKVHIARKLNIKPGMKVLEIGCGWGGMAITLARDFGADVVGITLSKEQLEYAKSRIAGTDLERRIEFRLQDYRDTTETYDRIVSVGMFEHVGRPHYPRFFNTVHDRLTEDGVALIHTIGRFTRPKTTSPWIEKYIFPGGYVPSMSELAPPIERSGMILCDLEVWRLHYAETLKHWHQRFMENRDKAVTLYDERFCRMWRFYLLAAEQTFRVGSQMIFQLQLTRDRNALPLTRDYLYPG